MPRGRDQRHCRESSLARSAADQAVCIHKRMHTDPARKPPKRTLEILAPVDVHPGTREPEEDLKLSDDDVQIVGMSSTSSLLGMRRQQPEASGEVTSGPASGLEQIRDGFKAIVDSRILEAFSFGSRPQDEPCGQFTWQQPPGFRYSTF